MRLLDGGLTGPLLILVELRCMRAGETADKLPTLVG